MIRLQIISLQYGRNDPNKRILEFSKRPKKKWEADGVQQNY